MLLESLLLCLFRGIYACGQKHPSILFLQSLDCDDPKNFTDEHFQKVPLFLSSDHHYFKSLWSWFFLIIRDLSFHGICLISISAILRCNVLQKRIIAFRGVIVAYCDKIMIPPTLLTTVLMMWHLSEILPIWGTFFMGEELVFTFCILLPKGVSEQLTMAFSSSPCKTHPGRKVGQREFWEKEDFLEFT